MTFSIEYKCQWLSSLLVQAKWDQPFSGLLFLKQWERNKNALGWKKKMKTNTCGSFSGKYHCQKTLFDVCIFDNNAIHTLAYRLVHAMCSPQEESGPSVRQFSFSSRLQRDAYKNVIFFKLKIWGSLRKISFDEMSKKREQKHVHTYWKSCKLRHMGNATKLRASGTMRSLILAEMMQKYNRCLFTELFIR